MQPSVQVVTVVPHFDPDSSRYRCWFGGCCRITTCVQIIGALELIGVIIDFISTVVQYARVPSPQHRIDLIVGIVTFLVFAAVIGMLFYGVAKQRAAFLIPHLVVQVMALVLVGVAIIIFSLNASAAAAGASVSYKSNDGSATSDETTLAVCVVILIILVIVFFLKILFFVNVLRCYRYLKEKTIFEQVVAAAPPPAYPAMVSHEAAPTNGYPSQGYSESPFKGGPA